MRSEFDDILRQKIEEGELPFEPMQWQKMAELLDEKDEKKRKAFILPLTRGLAAGVVFLIGFMFYEQLTTSDIPATTTVASGSKHISEPSQEKDNEEQPLVEAAEEESVMLGSVAPAVASRNTPNTTEYNGQINDQNTSKKNSRSIGLTQARSANNDKSLLADYAAKQASYEHSAATTKARSAASEADKVFAVKKEDKELYPVAADEQLTTPAVLPGASFSLGGGVNYGNLSAGYTVGVTAKKSISRRVFVEGDLALVNNNNSFRQYNATTMPNPNMSSSLGDATQTVITSEQVNNRFFYVQFMPSVGYKLSPKLNLSVGADVQQLVSDNEGSAATAFADNGLRVVPQTDFGLTGKTEVSLSSRIKTGVLYREGLNNMLYNGNYLNRRYVQFQMKYQLFGK